MDTKKLLEGLDENNITSILTKWQEVSLIRKELVNCEEMLKVKIKTYLKERQWDRLTDDETKISVSITPQKRETIDKNQLKTFLSDTQYAQILRITTFEKMTIMTPKDRERLKKYVGSKNP